MNRVRALLSTAQYRVPGVMVLGLGLVFLAGSAAAACSAWFYTGAENFKAAPGYAVARLLAASSGVTVTILKSLLPFFFGFIWDHHVPTALIVLVTWLCCLGMCWLTVVFAALEIPAIAALPTRSLRSSPSFGSRSRSSLACCRPSAPPFRWPDGMPLFETVPSSQRTPRTSLRTRPLLMAV